MAGKTDELMQRIHDLEAVLGQRDESILNTFRLGPKMNSLLGLLLALPTVNAEMIEQRLGIASNAKIAVHRLRNELKLWEIPIQSKRSVGYWLDDKSKAKIKGLLAGKPVAQDGPPAEAAGAPA